MTVRLNFIVEGQTEETFVNQLLRPHLGALAIDASARSVETSRKRGCKHRGGLGNYGQVRKDIVNWMKEDGKREARFTTMFDLYGLPNDFPGYEASKSNKPYQRVRILEKALGEDIADYRLIPYIQLHEFEALLLADPQQFGSEFDAFDKIQTLVEMVAGFESPELIDDGVDTAPSKRISEAIPDYGRRKASAGPIVAGKIGLAVMRSKCERFGKWLAKLESLADKGSSRQNLFG